MNLVNVKSTGRFWQIVVAFSEYINSNIQKNDVPNNFVGTFCVEFKIKFTDYIACVFKFSKFWKAYKVIHPKYYKDLKKGAHQSHLGRLKMGWFLAD